MMTESQLYAQVYNALVADTALSAIVSGRIYWLGKRTRSDIFPLIEYGKMGTIGAYSFGNDSNFKEESEDVVFQIKIYGSPTKIGDFQTMLERIRVVMHSIDYMEQAGSGLGYDEYLTMNIESTRWGIINV